jgi:hypothetical protein
MMQTDTRLTLWICSNFTTQPRTQPGHYVNWSHLSLDDLKFLDIRKSVCTSYPLMLLMYNALAVLLMQSQLREVHVMSLPRVHELLLGRSLLACLNHQGTTLWIDPVPSTSERLLQQELVRLFNEQALTLRGVAPLHAAARSNLENAAVTGFRIRIRFPA